MPGSYNPATHAINMPCGDTATISLKIPESAYSAVVFAIFDPKYSRDLLKIAANIAGGEAVIRLANRHTRDLRAGEYKWQLRFISDPEYDEGGNVIADEDSDNVVSYFGSEELPLPDFILRRDGAYV